MIIFIIAILLLTFSGSSSSALNLLNVQNIVIRHSSFRDCISNNSSKQFRGNSGAVSIAYYRAEEAASNSTTLTLSIDSCTFINNSAILSETNNDSVNLALNTNVYTARGGALGIIPQGFYNVWGEIKSTTFLQNHADSFGGSVYLLITGNETSHKFHFEDCRFLSSSAGNATFGGGMHIAFQIRNLISGPTKITFSRSRFEENSASFGGGLNIVQVLKE